MALFDFFRKRKVAAIEIETQHEIEKKNIDYSELVDVTKILTENNKKVLDKIELLVDKPLKFKEFFREWLTSYDFSLENEPDVITAYLLTGYNADSPYDFGGWVDWKEDGNEIVCSLEDGIINKQYPINLQEVQFEKEEFGEEAIRIISTHLKNTEYLLINWDIGGDCYHLFIIPKSNWQPLKKFGVSMEIDFYKV